MMNQLSCHEKNYTTILKNTNLITIMGNSIAMLPLNFWIRLSSGIDRVLVQIPCVAIIIMANNPPPGNPALVTKVNYQEI